jgi:probable F420-dependent oxidoreductase
VTDPVADGPLLGFGLPVSGAWAEPQHIRDVAVEAESLGYHSLWSFQRLLHPVDEDWGSAYHAVLDPLAPLAFTAAVTSRIRLGVAVVNLPYYAPLVLSKALTAVDVLSQGRLDVGLGIGWSPLEFAGVGASMKGRGSRAEEFVAFLEATWTQPEPEFSGEHYTLPRCTVEPKPVQQPRPPVLMGGGADVALRRIGRIADGWISSSRADLATIDRSIDLVRQSATQAGRDASALRFVVRGVVRLTDDDLDERSPLQGSVDQVRADLDRLARHGVTEVFVDCNWDPQSVSPEVDADAAVAHARHVMRALAPIAR